MTTEHKDKAENREDDTKSIKSIKSTKSNKSKKSAGDLNKLENGDVSRETSRDDDKNDIDADSVSSEIMRVEEAAQAEEAKQNTAFGRLVRTVQVFQVVTNIFSILSFSTLS